MWRLWIAVNSIGGRCGNVVWAGERFAAEEHGQFPEMWRARQPVNRQLAKDSKVWFCPVHSLGSHL